jgi:hypothetical protein
MALQRDTRYPGRWTASTGGHPQGAFKNRTAPGSLDGSYIEQDWANDWDGYFSSLLGAAGLTANGNVDAVGASQYFDALRTMLALQAGHGQCRLSVVSTTSITLKPFNGRNVIVNGVSIQIPTAGVAVNNAGLTANTTYYAYLSGTTVAPVLELATTGHSVGTNGVEIKTGDATRTLVGMVRTDASILFVDSALFRYCINWFNRRSISCSTYGVSFTVTGGGEVSSTIRNQFLTWGDEAVDSVANALAVMNTTAARIDFTLSANSATNSSQPEGFGRVTCSATAASATYAVPLNKSGRGVLPEGFGYTTAYSGVSSGNALVTIDIMTIIRG